MKNDTLLLGELSDLLASMRRLGFADDYIEEFLISYIHDLNIQLHNMERNIKDK